MPDSRSTLEILVDVKNARQGAADIKSVGQAAKDTGQQAETSGQGFQGMARNLAAAAGGAVAIRKGFQFMRGAAEGAASLAKETAQLTRTTGMDTQSASAWVSMAKNRGIQTDLLTRSFTAFSKQIRGAESGSKAAVKAFNDLGISADQLKGMNFDQTLMATADAFQQLPAGADKAAIAQQLFGRQAQALLPLLNLGSDGLREQMEVMKKHGLTLDENGVKKGLELAKAQREMRATTEGLKNSVGQALIPVLVAASQALLPLIQAFTWGMQNIPGFNYLVLALAAGLAGLLIASTVASAFSALGISMTIALGPVGLIIAGIAALAVGLVVAYKKVGWFRTGVDAAFNAIKAAVRAVAAAFTAAVGAVGSAIDAIVSKIKAMVEPITAAVGKVKDVLGGIGSAIGSVGGAIGSVLPFAAGGVVPSGGTLALVGERGPELMQLPGGARITPLQAGTQEPVDLGGYMGGDLHIHLDVDGRELAYVVARQTDIQKQRR